MNADFHSSDSNMSTLETLESQISAVMETVVEAAVTEIGRLLGGCSAHVMVAQHYSAPAQTVNNEEEADQASPPEDRQRFNKDVTNQFASLMESWTKCAVQKILMILKVSMCEAEDGAAAEEKSMFSDKTKQTNMMPKAGQEVGSKKNSGARSSRQKAKRIEGGLKPERRKENDHIYYREEQQNEEPPASAADSESVTEPDGGRGPTHMKLQCYHSAEDTGVTGCTGT